MGPGYVGLCQTISPEPRDPRETVFEESCDARLPNGFVCGHLVWVQKKNEEAVKAGSEVICTCCFNRIAGGRVLE